MIEMLKSKIHRARVTRRDINYEGSITIDKELCKKAGLKEFEKVDVYNINNGNRFTTYVIYGKSGEIQLNGAAARLCEVNDLVIIVSYCILDEKEAKKHKPVVIKL